MSRWIDADALKEDLLINHNTDLMSQSLVLGSGFDVGVDYVMQFIEDAPSIDLVRCAECKHRPIKEDADGSNYGFNLIEPNDGDERCPCLVSDGWYSWMPKDDFYCGYGERKESE